MAIDDEDLLCNRSTWMHAWLLTGETGWSWSVATRRDMDCVGMALPYACLC